MEHDPAVAEIAEAAITSSNRLPSSDATDGDAASASRTVPVAGLASKNTKVSKQRVPCRFFRTSGGCRAGAQCQFLHVPATLGSENAAKHNVPRNDVKPETEKHARVPKRQYQAHQVPRSKVVVKPEPATQISKRDHQINQVKRRFSALETSTVENTVLVFSFKPTDPDFPYELEALECILQVPKNGFPENEPHLTIQNKDMEKGFRINLENGFTSILRESPNVTLLSWLNTLDRQLENLLSGKKAETIKFVPNRPATTQPARAPSPKPVRVENVITQYVMEPVYSKAQRDAATARRERDTRQLEARLGRQAMYAKSSDGIAYTLPIEPRKKAELPPALQNVKSVRLFVPMLYPLLPCRIALHGVLREAAQPVEQAFEQKAKEDIETSLVGHINYLVTHMHIMATQVSTAEADVIGIGELDLSGDLSADEPESEQPSLQAGNIAGERSHVIFIPRPPEWNVTTKGPDNNDDSSDAEESSDESEDEAEVNVPAATSAPERGVSVDFTHLELHGIELLDLVSLNLTVRCLRCKETTDVENLRHTEANHQSARTTACKKCASVISLTFHRQFIHNNSVRAGYLDLDNCTVVDMLPSKFVPTCSNCSTTFADPGITSVRGDTSSGTCRKCHGKMSFQIPEIKFLLVSSSAKLAPVRKVKKVRENLGIRAGDPLPRHGRCSHYRKSFRWFRFSCCAKVYACDRCHDEKEAHPNEHANRMICGYCSREQRYRPEDCGICKAILVGKKYTGFWEGGQGTRDKVKMSRKDPRKYKRIGGGS